MSPHPNLIMTDCPVRHPAGECKSALGGFVPEGEGANVALLTPDSIFRCPIAAGRDRLFSGRTDTVSVRANPSKYFEPDIKTP